MLAGATAVGQLLRLVGTPVLTRIFAPGDYGILAVYGSIIALLLPIAALRYELAIPLPEDDQAAANLLALSLAVALGFSIIVGGACLFWSSGIAERLGAPSLSTYLWLLPIGIAGASGYSALNYWAVRAGAFGNIARTRLTQSVSQFVSQASLGLAFAGPIGLLVGDVVGRAAGTGALYSLAKRNGRLFAHTSWVGIRSVAKRYARFPLLSSPSALLNAAGLNVPTLLFATLYGPEAVGWFSLAQRVVGVPSTLIGQSVSQVYFGEAARLARDDPKRLRRLFWKTTGRLFLLGLIPSAILCIGGPWLFDIVFGEPWRVAGQYAQVLGPMFLVQFAVVPVSLTATVLERQDLQLAWDAGRFIIVVGSIAIAGKEHLPASSVVAIYSASMVMSYLFLVWMLTRALRQRKGASAANAAADDPSSPTTMGASV